MSPDSRAHRVPVNPHHDPRCVKENNLEMMPACPPRRRRYMFFYVSLRQNAAAAAAAAAVAWHRAGTAGMQNGLRRTLKRVQPLQRGGQNERVRERWKGVVRYFFDCLGAHNIVLYVADGRCLWSTGSPSHVCVRDHHLAVGIT